MTWDLRKKSHGNDFGVRSRMHDEVAHVDVVRERGDEGSDIGGIIHSEESNYEMMHIKYVRRKNRSFTEMGRGGGPLVVVRTV